jgi:NTP pyrophosphatase (non-canonical NTP hydrolase)
LRQLDRIKKTIFYGRDFLFSYDPGTVTIANLPNEIPLCNSKKAEYLIHAIIGVATEAGELLEALQAAILGKPFDEVNITEEQGDSFWYHAILANCSNTTFEEIQQINIAKLRARYPDKFNAHDANNRDLEAERTILETKPVINSKRGFNWILFAEAVLKHVEEYTVPQYGDLGEDQVTDYTAEDCMKQVDRYRARFGKNARPGQDKLDLLKMAHYISLAAEKM